MNPETAKKRKPRARRNIIGYLAIGFLLAFTLITKSHIILLLFLTFASAIINYETNMTPIRFNPQPEVFASLLLTKVMGFEYAVLMLILPTLIVDIYTARLDIDTFISLILTIIICYIISNYMLFSFVAFAILLVTIKFIIGLLFNILYKISIEEIIFEHILGYMANLILFLAFGTIFYNLFSAG
jgi:hypothetical protein